jgi:hypothetical protein
MSNFNNSYYKDLPNDSLDYRKTWYYRRSTRKPDSKGNREGKPSLEYNWREIGKIIIQQLILLQQPTDRELYYALISLKVFPNLHKAYQSLVRYMTRGRERGAFAADCLSDERHPIVNIQDSYFAPETWTTFYLDSYLGNISETFHIGGEYFPRWKGQKNYVEIGQKSRQ